MAVFSIHLQRKETCKVSFNADGNSKITTKGLAHVSYAMTCCNLDLAPCISQKVRDIHKSTLVGHLFSELFFELSHIYLITFCSNKHVLASVFFSVSESVKLHTLFWVTLPALTLKTILILAHFAHWCTNVTIDAWIADYCITGTFSTRIIRV